MKKILYIAFLSGLSLFSFAQEEVASVNEQKAPAKESSAFLPSAGTIAIGVDAIPYLEFVGNMFSGYTGKNTLSPSSTTIYGKYYLSKDAAVRADLYINNITNIDLGYVRDDANYLTNPNAQVEDKRKVKTSAYGIGLGYQMYKGSGKLRGTYGAVASYYRSNSTTDYEWGNQMTDMNITPTSTNWYGAGTAPSERNLSIQNQSTQSVGLGIIAGVEYFFVPRVCIGGELGLYYNYYWYSQESRKYETIQQGNLVEYELATDPKENYGSLSTRVYDTDNVAGRLYVLFHF